MSKIIRSTNAHLAAEQIIEIQLQSFFEPIHFSDQVEEAEDVPQLTLENIQHERQKMLQAVEQEIQAQRNHFDQFCKDQLAEIEALKQSWENEKIILQQQAYDEGFAQGYEDGNLKIQADMEQSLKTANATMILAEENAQKYIASQESVVLDLALTSAEHILNAVLDREEEQFISIIKRALKETREMKEVKLYVSPKYHEVVTKSYDEFIEMFPVNVPFMIFVNEDLHDHESYIETNHGRIVVSLDEQLQELRIQLNELLDSKE